MGEFILPSIDAAAVVGTPDAPMGWATPPVPPARIPKSKKPGNANGGKDAFLASAFSIHLCRYSFHWDLSPVAEHKGDGTVSVKPLVCPPYQYSCFMSACSDFGLRIIPL